MLINPRRLFGFMYLDFKDWLKYKYELFFWLLNTLIGAVTYAYLGSNVVLKETGILEKYGSFLAFILIGVAYNYIIYASIDAPRTAINPWNLMWNLLVPANLVEVVLGSILFRYFIGMFQFLMYLMVAFFFGVAFRINIVSTFFAIAVGSLIMWGLGMISAGVQIITKRWDPVTWFFTMLGGFLSGVWFPYQLLPEFLQNLSKIFPQTYILEMLRRAMLRGEGLYQMLDLLAPLFISAIIILSIGIKVYLASIEYAKEKGTVGEY